MTIYYVDATGGDDGKDGQSIANAWKTISKVNGSAFSAGDQVLFKRAETWRETLLFPSSGAVGNPITIGAYGVGANPLVNGADVITGWTLDAGTTYHKAGITTQPNLIFYDNTRLLPGVFSPVESADLFNEKFEATGFDEPGWTKNGTPNEDALSSAAGSPSGWGNQCLGINVADNTDQNIVRALSSQQAVTYFRLEVVLTVSGLAVDSDRHLLANTYTDTYANVWWITISQVSGAMRFVLFAVNDGALNGFTGFPVVSLDTRYCVEVKWDANADAWAWKIDGVAQPNNVDASDPVTSEGTLTGSHAAGVRRISVGARAFGANWKSYTGYIDLVAMDDTSWVNQLSDELPSNTFSYDSGTDTLYVNVGEDPATHALEATQRPTSGGDGIVDFNGKSYVTIDSLDAIKSNECGIHNYAGSAGQTHQIVQNCEVSNCAKGGIVLASDSQIFSNALIDSNTVHHVNLDETNVYEAITVMLGQDFEIKNNTVHDHCHEGIDVHGGNPSGVSLDGLIHNNTIYGYAGADSRPALYFDGANGMDAYSNLIYGQKCIAVPYALGVFINSEIAGIANSNIRIYYNIFYDCNCGAGIKSQNGATITNIYFYNNVFAKHTRYGLYYDAACDGHLAGDQEIINNIFWGSTVKQLTDSTPGDYAFGLATIDHNLFQTGDPTDTTGTNPVVTADAKFADYAANDYHILAGSPAINAGIDVGLTVDFDGNPIVGLPDIGAYEFPGSTYNDSISLARSMVITEAGNINASPSFSLSRSMSMSEGGGIDASPAISLARSMGIAEAGLADISPFISLSRSDAITPSNQLDGAGSIGLGRSMGITDAGNIDVSPSLSLDRSMGMSEGGGIDASHSISLPRSMTLTLGTDYQLAGGITLSRVMAITNTGGLDGVGAISLSRLASIALGGTLDTGAQISLPRSAGLSIDQVLDAVGELLLSRSMSIIIAGQMDGVASIILARSDSIDFGPDSVLAENISLGKALSLSVVDVLDAVGVLGLGKTLDWSTAGVLDTGDALALGKTLGLSIAQALEVTASLSLARSMAADFANTANIDASIALALAFGLVSASAVIRTPPSRIYAIPGENRILVIDAENRVYVISG